MTSALPGRKSNLSSAALTGPSLAVYKAGLVLLTLATAMFAASLPVHHLNLQAIFDTNSTHPMFEPLLVQDRFISIPVTKSI